MKPTNRLYDFISIIKTLNLIKIQAAVDDRAAEVGQQEGEAGIAGSPGRVGVEAEPGEERAAADGAEEGRAEVEVAGGLLRPVQGEGAEQVEGAGREDDGGGGQHAAGAGEARAGEAGHHGDEGGGAAASGACEEAGEQDGDLLFKFLALLKQEQQPLPPAKHHRAVSFCLTESFLGITIFLKYEISADEKKNF